MTKAKTDTAQTSLVETLEQNSSLRTPLVVMVLTVIGVLGVSLGASLWVQIDGAVIAPGELRVSTQKTLIQHTDGGRIAALHIENGRLVSENDVVLRLDDSRPQLARSKLLTEIDSLQRQRQRLRAVLQDDLSQISEGAAAQLSTAQLDQRQGASIEITVSRIKTFNQADRADIAAIIRVLSLQEEQIQLLEKQLTALEDSVTKASSLVAQGLETERALKELQGQQRSQQVALVQAQQAAAQSKREITALEAQIAKRIFEFQQSRLEELIKTEDALERAQAEIKQIDEELAGLELRAGLSGRITNMAELNVGAVLRGGEVVAEIIPTDQNVLAEIFVGANEIDLLEPGGTAQLELSTLKRATDQRLAAKIETIAADLKVFEDGATAFPVRLSLVDRSQLPDELARNGVPVTGYIPTQSRSLGSYLVSPIIDWSRKVFREY